METGIAKPLVVLEHEADVELWTTVSVVIVAAPLIKGATNQSATDLFQTKVWTQIDNVVFALSRSLPQLDWISGSCRLWNNFPRV